MLAYLQITVITVLYHTWCLQVRKIVFSTIYFNSK